MARVLSFLIRYFSNYYTLHRSDLAARAAPLDPRLHKMDYLSSSKESCIKTLVEMPIIDRCEDLGQRVIVKVGDRDDIHVTCETIGNIITTTTRWTHRCHQELNGWK